MPDSTLLDPVVLDHLPEYSEQNYKCRSCKTNTHWYCPGCAAADHCGPASGFYCFGKNKSCYVDQHRKRARTKA